MEEEDQPTPLPTPSDDDDSPKTAKAKMKQAERNSLLCSAPFYKIVLTGGPCGGKTTSLARLSSYLRERGFEVITSPEAFSILISNGMSMEYFAVDGMDRMVQSTVMDLQVSLEDGFERLLRARGKPAVLLCDRGLMDGSAYMSPDDWRDFLDDRGLESDCELREGRYHAVFHLVTAAEGAEPFYTLENNEVRTETPEEARKLDRLTRRAWVGHPRLCVLDNSTDFEGKLSRLVDATARLVGLPSRLSRTTTKFLLRSPPRLEDFPDDVKYHVFEVEKIYLYDDVNAGAASTEEKKAEEGGGGEAAAAIGDEGSPGGRRSSSLPLPPSSAAAVFEEEYSFVRRRTHIDSATGKVLGSAYGQTTVRRTRPSRQGDGEKRERGQVIEVKRILTKREFEAARRNRDPSRHVVRQRRISFLYEMQSFNVHAYESPADGLCVLHAQVEGKEGDDGADGDVNDADGGSTSKGEDGGKEGTPKGGPNDVKLPPFLDVERRLENTREDEERYGAFNISLRKN